MREGTNSALRRWAARSTAGGADSLRPPAVPAQRRAPEPFRPPATEPNVLARRLEREARRLRHVIDEADAADRRRGRNASAHRFVVERDVAGDDGKVERPRRLADAL